MIGNEETVIHPKAAEILDFFDELEKEVEKIDLSLTMRCAYKQGSDISVQKENLTGWSTKVRSNYRYLRVILGQAECFLSLDLDDGTTWGYVTLGNGRPGRIPNKTKRPGKLNPNTLLKILYRFNFDSVRTVEVYYQNWLLGVPVVVPDPSNCPLFN